MNIANECCNFLVTNKEKGITRLAICTKLENTKKSNLVISIRNYTI